MTDLQDLAVNRAAEVILSAMLGRVVGDRADKIAYDAAQSLAALGLLRHGSTPDRCAAAVLDHLDTEGLPREHARPGSRQEPDRDAINAAVYAMQEAGDRVGIEMTCVDLEALLRAALPHLRTNRDRRTT